jgi:hypothetical protein
MTVIDESTLSLTSLMSILDVLLLHIAALVPINPLIALPFTSNPKLSLSLETTEEE